MKFIFAGTNVNVTRLKGLAEEKLSKLDQYFDKDLECHVTFSRQREMEIVEVTIYLPGDILRAEEATPSFRDSIDRVLDSLERQVHKYKTRLQKRYKNNETIKFANIEDLEDEEEDDEPKIVKTKSFALKPMTPEEACLQMDLLSHQFFIFQDGNDGEVKLVYKRNDGDYGLIEAETN